MGFNSGFKGLNNVQLYDLNSSQNITGVIESRKMRWAGHVALMGEGRGGYGVLVRKPEARRPRGRLVIYEYKNIILEWIFKNRLRGRGLD